MPRARDENGARINLPRPPTTTARGTLPRPAVSPRGTPDIRARGGEVIRPAPRISQAPAHTKQAIEPTKRQRFIRKDGRMEEEIPRPPQPEEVEIQEKVTPEGAREVRERLRGERVAEEYKQDQRASEMQRETEMAPEGTTTPAPPKKTSPLGQNSPIEQITQAEPMPLGREHHLREIGISVELPPEQAKVFEQQAVRDFQRFGSYRGEDDPNSPKPPIRPGKHTFNSETGEWIKPEGKVSMLDRLTKISSMRGTMQRTGVR